MQPRRTGVERDVRPQGVDHLLAVEAVRGLQREQLDQPAGRLPAPAPGRHGPAVDDDLEPTEQPNLDPHHPHPATAGRSAGRSYPTMRVRVGQAHRTRGPPTHRRRAWTISAAATLQASATTACRSTRGGSSSRSGPSPSSRPSTGQVDAEPRDQSAGRLVPRQHRRADPAYSAGRGDGRHRVQEHRADAGVAGGIGDLEGDLGDPGVVQQVAPTPTGRPPRTATQATWWSPSTSASAAPCRRQAGHGREVALGSRVEGHAVEDSLQRLGLALAERPERDGAATGELAGTCCCSVGRGERRRGCQRDGHGGSFSSGRRGPPRG